MSLVTLTRYKVVILYISSLDAISIMLAQFDAN